jgi:hypothetical protein
MEYTKATEGSEILDKESLDTTPDSFTVAGSQGAVIYNGYLQEDERDSRVAGKQKYLTYSNFLANTTIVAAGVRLFLNLICKAGWRVDPADDSAESAQRAEDVELIMKSMRTPWHRVVRRAAMSRFYGFSIQEWTAKRLDEGFVGFLDISPRAQKTIDRWDVDRTGEVLGVVQRDPQTQDEIYLPRTKIIYMVDDTLDDSPEGLGLFRHIVKSAHRLERYEMLEGWSFERDLRGTPIGRGPLTEIARQVKNGTLKPAEAAALKEPIETFIKKALAGKDTGLFLESQPYKGTGDSNTPGTVPQWDVELLKGDPKGQAEVATAIERVTRDIARVLGVDHLLLGGNDRGSFAMSKDKSQSFGVVVDSTLTEIRATFQSDFLDPIWVLNGWDPKTKPTFKTEAIAYRDIEQVVDALLKLSQAGAPLMPNDPAINEIREQIGLSDAEEISDLDLSNMFNDPTAKEEDGDQKESPSGDSA